MSEFYPLIARAVLNLRDGGAQARNQLYDHARKLLLTQLSADDSRPSTLELMREQIALEAAIRRVEAETHAGWAVHGDAALTSHASYVAPKPSASNHSWSDCDFDLPGQRGNVLTWPDIQSQEELLANGGTPACAAIFTNTPVIQKTVAVKAKQRGVEKIAPSDVSRGTSITLGVPDITQPDAKRRPEEAKDFYQSNGPVIFLALASIVGMLMFIAIISIPAIVIYFPRLIWFSEHLVDHPGAIVGILIALALTMFPAFLLFRLTRKRSALRFSLVRHFLQARRI